MRTVEGDVRGTPEAMMLKRDDQSLGRGEFDLRTTVLGMARHIIEATVSVRKRGG